MAEEQDNTQKTEDPTQKKLEESHKKGDVAKSQEVRHWTVLVAAAIALASVGDSTARSIRDSLKIFIAKSHALPADGHGILNAIWDLGVNIFLALSIPLGIIILGGFAGAALQHKPLWTAERIKPKLEKISPLKGLKRLFSANSLMEFAKTLAKFVIVALVAFTILWPERDRLATMMTVSIDDVVALISGLALKVLLGVVAVMTVIAIIDVIFQRHQHHEKLKMTKQEVKDEHKQLEGDPQVKARLRQIRMEKSRKRMMAAVPESDVVITNPTHYAVALKYEHGVMDVPILVAKGTDAVAARIRALAEEHGIAIVENPALARALFATVELEEEIPSDHYQAVAEVIGYVLRLRQAGRNPYGAYKM